ncbi:MAG: isochorismatase family protein [Oligoflexales bacterium]
MTFCNKVFFIYLSLMPISALGAQALMIVDVQNDFLPQSFYEKARLSVPEGDKIIPIIAELKRHFSFVVLTQDYHPSGHISFLSTHMEKDSSLSENDAFKPYRIQNNEGEYQECILWPDHCVFNDKDPDHQTGVDFPKELNVVSSDVVFRKGKDINTESYSAFQDQKGQDTGLHEFLQNNLIDNLVIVGLAMDICVFETAKDAVKLGYDVSIPLDATKATSQKLWEEKAAALDGLGVFLTDSSMYLK